ncbi:hypothetical protein [Mycolicibacter minnesotensis]
MIEKQAVISPLYDYVESGKYVRKSATFIRSEVHAGRLTIKRVGRTPLIHRDELDRWLAEDAPSETGDAARRPNTGRGKKKVSA